MTEVPDHVHAGGVDHLGTWRGKRFTRATYEAGAHGQGLPFSDVFWAITIAEDLVEPPSPDHPRYGFARSSANSLSALSPTARRRRRCRSPAGRPSRSRA